MIKKLKIRFIVITMVLISFVLITMFSVIVISSAIKMKNESFQNLDKEYTMFESVKKDNMPIMEEKAHDAPAQLFEERSPFYTFFVVLDEDFELVELFDITGQISNDDAEKIALETLKMDVNQGSNMEYHIRFKVYENDTKKIIGFIDNSYEIEFLRSQIINYALVFATAIIAFLVISFILSNFVVRPIDKAWKQQQQFVSDASHELRTPITVMLTNTAILQKRLEKRKEDLKWVGNISTEARHMKKLVEELLFLARVDSRREKGTFQVISLSNVVFESCLALDSVFYDAGRSLKTDIEPGINIYGNSSHVKQLINILLDNAKKYSYEDSQTTIKLLNNQGKAVLSVHNFGKEIEQDLVSKIFDRFYMINKARTRDSDSYGLGLAIAKEIIELHKGKIEVYSDKDNGTTFEITFDVK